MVVGRILRQRSRHRVIGTKWDKPFAAGQRCAHSSTASAGGEHELVHDGVRKGVPANSIAKATAIAAERRVRLRHAYQSGVKFALGTDATSDIHGRNGEEFKYMVDILGATPMEAISIGTLNAATLLGVEKEYGTVAVGKVADLVAVQGNPLARCFGR